MLSLPSADMRDRYIRMLHTNTQQPSRIDLGLELRHRYESQMIFLQKFQPEYNLRHHNGRRICFIAFVLHVYVQKGYKKGGKYRTRKPGYFKNTTLVRIKVVLS